MRTLAGLGLVLALAAAGRAGDEAPAAPPAAQYEGKSAAEWTTLLASDDVKLRQKAAYALFKLGKDAAPAAAALVKALRDADAYVRTTSAKALPRLPAESVKPLVPALAGELASERQEVRREAASVLWRLGPLAADVVPELTKALASADELVRANAAGSLANARAAAKSALLALGKTLEDADENVRKWAVKALVEIDPAGSFASKTTAVRLAAVQTYASPDRRAWTQPDIVAAVLEAIEDPSEEVRGWAVHALDTYALFIGDERPVAWIEVFTKALTTSRTPGVQANAACGLARYAGHGPQVLPYLVATAKSREPEARIGALTALGMLGAEARDAVPVVLEAMRSDHEDARRIATYVVAQIAAHGDQAVLAALTGATRDAGQSTRSTAVSSLAVVGKGSRATATELVRCLGDGSSSLNVRATAARHLAKVGVPDVAIPALTAELEKDTDVLPSVAVSLCELDAPAAKKAMERLVGLVDAPGQKYDVAMLLAQLGPRAAPAVPALIRLLENTEPGRRQSAATALGAIGAAAKDALPVLERLQSDQDANMSVAADAAVKAIRRALAAPK
jgi:HEAT repeat protein